MGPHYLGSKMAAEKTSLNWPTGSLQVTECKPLVGPILFYKTGSHWPIKHIVHCRMKMLYGPTLFQCRRMAAKRTSRIGPCYKCSSPCRYTRTGPWQPESNQVQALGQANFILDNRLALAHRVQSKLPHENAIWAHIISRQENGSQANLSHWPML